jgi:hypothetical protein
LRLQLRVHLGINQIQKLAERFFAIQNNRPTVCTLAMTLPFVLTENDLSIRFFSRLAQQCLAAISLQSEPFALFLAARVLPRKHC